MAITAAIVATTGLAAVVVATTGAGTASAAGTTLRTAAESQNRYFGSDFTQDLINNSTVTTLQAAQFDMVTPGNEMKWQTTEPNQNQFNFGPGDAIVNYATSHNERVRGHNLVWHSQLAGWVTGLPLSSVKAAMENHITQEVTHYKGKIYAWDVVNEPFDDGNPSQPRNDVFFQAFNGISYIADALTTAHAADPAAKLYLNDYNIELPGSKQDAMFNLASSLKSQGVPLDGIGFESHFVIGQLSNEATLQSSMARFTALGLDVAITELDDRFQSLPPSSSGLQQQATEFGRAVQACVQTPRCPGVTQWAVGDADSWVPGAFSGQGAATMFDNNYQPKPAFTAALAAMNGGSAPPTTMGPPSSSPPRSSAPPSSPPPSSSPSRSSSPPPPGACSATYTPVNSWPGGFQAGITVTAGSSAISSWTLKWTLASGQTITQLWNGALTTSGTSVTVTNLSYNGSIAAGGNTTLGFTANGTPSTPTITCTSP
jgi:endo-1,4-beta-xylanase